MVHRGNKVRQIVRDLGISLYALSKGLNVSRSTIYRYLDDPVLSWKIIYDIGTFIRYDFSKDFPEMPIVDIEKNLLDIANEPDIVYGESVYELRKQLRECREKYMSLLEKYTQLLEKRLP